MCTLWRGLTGIAPCACSKDPLDRFLGASLLCTTGYMHWAQSHLAHHVKVAALCSCQRTDLLQIPCLNRWFVQLWENVITGGDASSLGAWVEVEMAPPVSLHRCLQRTNEEQDLL